MEWFSHLLIVGYNFRYVSSFHQLTLFTEVINGMHSTTINSGNEVEREELIELLIAFIPCIQKLTKIKIKLMNWAAHASEVNHFNLIWDIPFEWMSEFIREVNENGL